MSLYLGDQQIKNVTFTVNGTNTVSQSQLMLDVTTIGIVANNKNVSANNSAILKEYIDTYYHGEFALYFPAGIYYFDAIEITNTEKAYTINLYGESNSRMNSSWSENAEHIPGIENSERYYCAEIRTKGQNFIMRTNTTGVNTTTFNVKNIRFNSIMSYAEKPTGTCLGATTDLRSEYNFYFDNVYFVGFEYGFYSPGYTCGGSRGYHINFNHCKYGIYIQNASHNFILDDVNIGYCKYGIRFGTGGNPCNISNIHVAVGCFEGMNDYLKENPKMYAIHCKGSVVIDAMYWEQYSPIDVSNYTLIDYEGWGQGGLNKVIIKNTPINCMGAGDKGYFFTGDTFIGAGIETGKESVIRLDRHTRQNNFGTGCVDFINCLLCTSKANNIKNIKKCFNIYGGLNSANGFVFDGKDLFGNGIAFTNNYIRRFKTTFTTVIPNATTLIGQFSYNSIPEANRTYDGVAFKISPVVDNSENADSIHYTGSITINKIDNTNLNVTLGIYGTVDGTVTMIREYIKLDSSTVGKKIIIRVDDYISKTEATNVFFGYKANTSATEGIFKAADMEKILFDIKAENDDISSSSESYSNSIVSVTNL